MMINTDIHNWSRPGSAYEGSALKENPIAHLHPTRLGDHSRRRGRKTLRARDGGWLHHNSVFKLQLGFFFFSTSRCSGSYLCLFDSLLLAVRPSCVLSSCLFSIYCLQGGLSITGTTMTSSLIALAFAPAPCITVHTSNCSDLHWYLCPLSHCPLF